MDYKRNLNSTKRSSHPYTDNYTGFIWDSVHSSRYNCFIENTGKLTFEPNPSFSNQFVQPVFQNRSYYVGVQTNTKKISLNLVFYHLTLHELNDAIAWLNRTKISSLLLDYAPYWRYDCKLASMGTMEKYVDGSFINPDTYQREDLYICKVPVSFETISYSEATSTYTVFYSPNLPDGYFLVRSPTERLLVQPFHAPFIVNDGSEGSEGSEQSEEDALLNEFYLPEYLAPNIPTPLVTATKNEQTNVWDIYLFNPTSVATFFRLNCYKVSNNQLQVDYTLADVRSDIDAADNSVTILLLVMNLDEGHFIHAHYNSEDGSLLTAGQSVEMAQGYNRHNICSYAQSAANVYIPAANNGQNGILHLQLTGSDNWSIEYDLRENMI